MARQRLGVVLVVPQPLAAQVDGLRRALGDGGLARIAPHITIVPPVNVHERDLHKAFAVVRAAAAGVPPLTLHLGPVRTFAPVNPVAYLAVGGVGGIGGVLGRLDELRRGCLQGPLDRTSEHEFVPHVTVADDLSSERLAAVAGVLADFSLDVTFDRVHVLAERPGRTWEPVAEASLGERPATIGRGSLPLDLVVSGRPDLEAATLLALESEPAGLPFAISAFRAGQVVAAAWGWSGRGALEVADLVVVPEHRGQGIGRHVVAAVMALARRRGCATIGMTAPGDGAGAALLAASGFEMTADARGTGSPRRWSYHLPVDEPEAGG